MKKLWMWVGAATVLLGATGLVGARTEHGKRAIRYLDRRYQITEQGRRDAFDALWLQGKREYNAKAEPRWGAPFQQADYPAKAKLLARHSETLFALKRDLASHADENFVMAMLLDLGPNTARPILTDALHDGLCYYPTPAFTAALAGSFTPEQLQQMALDLPGNCGMAAYLALPKTAETPDFMETLVVKKTGSEGLPWWLLNGRDQALIASRNAYPKLDRAGKISVIRSASFNQNTIPPVC